MKLQHRYNSAIADVQTPSIKESAVVDSSHKGSKRVSPDSLINCDAA